MKQHQALLPAAMRSIAAGIVLLATAMNSQAALIGSCTIIVGAQGKMVTGVSLDTMSSTTSGGAQGRATVTASSLLCAILRPLDCFTVSAPAPLLFTSAPSGGSLGTTFDSRYAVDGGAAQLGAIGQSVLNGTHNVDIDLTATKASGVFPQGNYRAEVTLRCE